MSYSIHALAEATGYTPRGIQYYVGRGLLASPGLHGPATRYGEDARVRLRAARKLRLERHLRLAEIRRIFASSSPAELLRLAGLEPAAPAAPAVPAVDLASAAPGGRLGPYRPAAAGRASCEHLAICPGVELVVRADADPEALRVAREILATYVQP